LDYEIESQYILTVEAYDCGIPSRVTSTNVTVYVNDVNDNAPIITPSSAVVHIKENMNSPQTLLQVIFRLLTSGGGGGVTRSHARDVDAEVLRGDPTIEPRLMQDRPESELDPAVDDCRA